MTETPQENGIAGVKKIKFDFEFTYSKDGDDDIGDTIVLIAPSFEDIETNALMTSLVTKGMVGALPLLRGLEPVSDDDDDGGEITAGVEEGGSSSREGNAMWLMAIGMKDKKYIEFVRYVKKLLTNDSRYARIEGEEIGITDLLWKEIGRQGGRPAVDRILSEFVSFFIEDMQGKKAA